MGTPAPMPLPQRPQPPEPGDCCGGGCERCVIDAYEERLREWEEAVAALRARAGLAGPP